MFQDKHPRTAASGITNIGTAAASVLDIGDDPRSWNDKYAEHR
jgi:hypothetical protein